MYKQCCVLYSKLGAAFKNRFIECWNNIKIMCASNQLSTEQQKRISSCRPLSCVIHDCIDNSWNVPARFITCDDVHILIICILFPLHWVENLWKIEFYLPVPVCVQLGKYFFMLIQFWHTQKKAFQWCENPSHRRESLARRKKINRFSI